jgi:hypothetical protein
MTTRHPLSPKVDTNLADSGCRPAGIVRSRTKATELTAIASLIRPLYQMRRSLTENFRNVNIKKQLSVPGLTRDF